MKKIIILFMVLLMIPSVFAVNYRIHRYNCGYYDIGCKISEIEIPAGASGGSEGSRGGGCDVFADHYKKCFHIGRESLECEVGCYEGYYCNESYRCNLGTLLTKTTTETLLARGGKKSVIISVILISLIVVLLSDLQKKRKKKKKEKEKQNKIPKIGVITILFLILGTYLVVSARMPLVDGDYNDWGVKLNEFLNVSHYENGTLKIQNETIIRSYNVTWVGTTIMDNITLIRNWNYSWLSNAIDNGSIVHSYNTTWIGEKIMDNVTLIRNYNQTWVADDVMDNATIIRTSNLSDYNTSAEINGSYVPYVGAYKNVKLGTNNFTVGNGELHVSTVTGQGKVGIGTTLPKVNTQLHVHVDGYSYIPTVIFPDILLTDTSTASDGATFSMIGGNAGESTMRYGDTDDENAGEIMYDHITDSFNFTVNANKDALIINSLGNVIIGNGNVGIGTITPDSELDVHGSVNITRNQSIGGSLYLGNDSRNLKIWLNEPGDILTEGRFASDGTVIGFARKYSVGLMALENDGGVNFSSLGKTASVSGTTQAVCDSTNPWKPHHVDMWLTVLESTPSYKDATGEITDYLNSSCIRVSFASAGDDTIVDGEDMSYIVYPHPVFGALDNGFISANIGNNPDARFEIHINNGTGERSGLYLDAKAGTDDYQAVTIDLDGYAHDGIIGQNIYIHSSVPVVGKSAIAQYIEIDGTGVTEGDATFIEASLVGSPTDSTTDLIRTSPNLNHLIHVGSPDRINQSWIENSSGIYNVTAEFTSTGDDIEFFNEDDSYIYIGNEGNFTNIGISLDTESSQDALTEYYYCNLTYNWSVLPGVTDTTAGMTTSGSIVFPNPIRRGKCNKSIEGNSMGRINYTYIALKRTRGFIVTPPIENLITISGATDYFILQEDLMKVNPVDTAPLSCPGNLGALYFDISEDGYCQCKSTGWKVIEDGSECT